MRIVSWNIRAGGGVRGEGISAQFARWSPDVAVLSEFRATPASAVIASRLADGGLAHQLSAGVHGAPAANGLLVASRWPLVPLRFRAGPMEPGRWLPVAVVAPEPLVVGAMHIPNENTRRKFPFMDALHAIARTWRRGPALFIGDTNSGRPLVDEQSPVFGPRYTAWFERMAAAGWQDAFRHLHPESREYTWYSPNRGNGFRLDEAFVNRALLPRVTRVHHAWGVGAGARPDELSDHAALILEVE